MRPQIETRNGRYAYRTPTGDVLTLADPPEAGWLLEDPGEPEIVFRSGGRAGRQISQETRIAGGGASS